ncbi:unnamed protein product, partial [marine sediment metagenome]
MSNVNIEITAYKTLMPYLIHATTRMWYTSFLPPLVAPALFIFIFGAIVGARIAPVEGLNYMQYIAPGLAIMVIMNVAYADSSGFFYHAKSARFIEQALVSPTSIYVVLGCYISIGMLNSLFLGLIMMLFLSFYASISIASITITLSTAVLASLIFSMAGIISA